MRTFLRASFLICLAVAPMTFGDTKAPPGSFGCLVTNHPPSDTFPSGWLIVEEVAPASPASDAGLQARDMIVAINDRPVSFRSDLQALEFFAGIEAGQTVSMTIRRGATTRRTKITARVMTAEQHRILLETLKLVREDEVRAERSRQRAGQKKKN